LVQLLCEKLSINPYNIEEERKKIEDRSKIEQRLEAI
jgi:hypothetical protein